MSRHAGSAVCDHEFCVRIVRVDIGHGCCGCHECEEEP